MSYILLTNDDGVSSPGLYALRQALQTVTEVVVFAPDHSWSAAGHTKTMHKPLRVYQTRLCDGTSAYTTNGSPSDAVALALLGILPTWPALVVSGINLGPNLGHDVTYSGTVAAAMEAAVFGLPAIAVSLDLLAIPPGPGEEPHFEPVARFAAHLARIVLERGLPHDTLLNVNAPNLPQEALRGVQVTRLGQRIYRDVLIEREDPRGHKYYWIGGEPPGGLGNDGTDLRAVADGYLSLTPLHLDLTAHDLLPDLEGWKLHL